MDHGEPMRTFVAFDTYITLREWEKDPSKLPDLDMKGKLLDVANLLYHNHIKPETGVEFIFKLLDLNEKEKKRKNGKKAK